MSPFIFNTTKSVVFENGAAQRLSELAGSLLGAVCLLVTDSGLRKLGLVDATVSSLEATGHTVVIFDEVEADPSRETLMKAVETGRAAGVTSVIGFGGGSSAAGIDPHDRGYRLGSYTGVDHNRRGRGKTRGVFARDLARYGDFGRRIDAGFACTHHRRDGDRCYGTCDRGICFEKCEQQSDFETACARSATSFRHGLSNALVLPHVLRFNAPDAGSLYAEIAGDAFPHLAEIAGTQARTAAFIDALADLAKRVGLQTRLRDVDIPKSAIDKMAADAMLQTRLLVNNPREVTQDDARMIYTAAW